jgi:hypothetical protein
VAITPDTRIGDFLEAHPDLQEALIARVPAFAKLRNPVLRRTVAKLATVDQAARIAGIPTAELVRFLRDLTGESGEGVPDAPAPLPEARPEWAWPESLQATVDAEAALAAGEHPLARVRTALRGLASGEAMQLLSAFRPEPLLAELAREGVPCWCQEEAPGCFRTWILKA